MTAARASRTVVALAIGLVAAAGLASVGPLVSRPLPARRAVEPAVATAAIAAGQGAGRELPPGRAYAARARVVQEACDLDLTVVCRGGTCAAVALAPDLDAPWGWATLAWTSPRFVATTALRDLGVPAPGLPCGTAIAAFVGDDGVIAATSPDGSEVWCATDGDPEAGRALCGSIARVRHGLPAAGFADPSLRRRTFDKR